MDEPRPATEACVVAEGALQMCFSAPGAGLPGQGHWLDSHGTRKVREAENTGVFFLKLYYTVKNTTIPESYFKDSQVDRPYITVQLRRKG